MSAAKEYTEEEIAAAWEAAEHFPGQDPAKVRIDNVNDMGAALHRDKFGPPKGRQRGGGYWQIDDQRRARHAGYTLSEALRAERLRMEQAERDGAEKRRRENAAKAEAGGLPNTEIFDRLDALERAVAEIRKGRAAG